MSNIKLIHGDCMDIMKQYPDKYFDLAVVDPPYGIGISKKSFRSKHIIKNWDNEIPSKEYFTELFRVSKNQIIWGGNYFDLPPTQNYIIWDKVQPFDFTSAMAELAWCSIQMPIKIFKKHVVTAEANKIHPTQKPIALYRWLLDKYATKDMKILDTHLGSASSAIAAYQFGINEFVGVELDGEYYEAAMKRFKLITSQQQLF